MFSFFERFKSLFESKKKVKVLIIGLDHSGKTTIVQQLRHNHFESENAQTVPTVGFQVETFSREKLQFTVFDMSGQGRYRDIWSHYYMETDGIIFVLDASDKTRSCVVKDELSQMIHHPSIKSHRNKNKRKLPILFFLNKIDIDGCMGLEECKIATGITDWEHECEEDSKNGMGKKTIFEWKVQPCQADVGKGLNEGFAWLSDRLNDIFKVDGDS